MVDLHQLQSYLSKVYLPGNYILYIIHTSEIYFEVIKVFATLLVNLCFTKEETFIITLLY